MNERTRKILVYSTLPLAMAWAAYNFLDRKTDPASATPQAAPTAAVATTAIVPRPVNFAKIDSLPWGSDPFRCDEAGRDRPIAREGGLAWALSGIVYSNQYPLAFVNGRSVAVGDTIMGAVVVSIDPRTVTLEIKGERVQLRVNKG